MNNKKLQSVTVCAFSIKPYSGSEWGVGWNYFLFCVEKFRAVKLVCRSSEGQRQAILQYISKNNITNCELHFIEDTSFLRKLLHKKLFRAYIVIEYFFWQVKCVYLLKCMDVRHDVLLHVTWVSDWLPSFIHISTKAWINIYGPVGSQNANFNKSKFSKYNAFYILKKFIRYNPINIINAYKADGLFSISNKFSEQYPWKLVERQLIMSPVNSEITITRRSSNGENAKSLCFIGKYLEFKNFDLFVHAANHLLDLGLVDKIDVYGDFPAVVTELHPSINFHGHTPQQIVYDRLSADHSIIFQPSCEAGGTIGIEALSVGIPIVTFSSFGLSEFVKDHLLQISYDDEWLESLQLLVKRIHKDYDVISEDLQDLFQREFSKQRNYTRFSHFLDTINAHTNKLSSR